MLLSTPGLVLHTTPYAETSVVVRVFTRQQGVCSYLVKGVRSRAGRVKQNLLEPLSSLDMVVYDSRRGGLGYIRELSPRHPRPPADAVGNALRFFMTEVLHKALREQEPMPDLWDYAEQAAQAAYSPEAPRATLPLAYLLRVSAYLGIVPLDNYCPREPLFCLEEGRFVAMPNDTTLPTDLSSLLHRCLVADEPPAATLAERSALLQALIAYFQLHLSGFRHFTSHEILHTVLK